MKLTKPAMSMLNDLNKSHAVVMVGGKCWIMNIETEPSGQSSISFSSEKDFTLRYADHKIPIIDNSGKKVLEPI